MGAPRVIKRWLNAVQHHLELARALRRPAIQNCLKTSGGHPELSSTPKPSCATQALHETVRMWNVSCRCYMYIFLTLCCYRICMFDVIIQDLAYYVSTSYWHIYNLKCNIGQKLAYSNKLVMHFSSEAVTVIIVCTLAPTWHCQNFSSTQHTSVRALDTVHLLKSGQLLVGPVAWILWCSEKEGRVK